MNIGQWVIIGVVIAFLAFEFSLCSGDVYQSGKQLHRRDRDAKT